MNKYGRRGHWKLTNFGTKVQKRLIEKNMTSIDLAREVGISRSFLSQMLYGHKNDKKYIDLIRESLGMELRDEEEKVSGE